MTCNLLLVDDHSLIRAGVRALVADIPGYAVIGEANDGSQLLELVLQLDPDIVLLDVRMPGLDGLQVAARLCERENPPAVVFCAAQDEFAIAALQARTKLTIGHQQIHIV